MDGPQTNLGHTHHPNNATGTTLSLSINELVQHLMSLPHIHFYTPHKFSH